MDIKTKEDWWELVNNNWHYLKELVIRYYPCLKDPNKILELIGVPEDGWNVTKKDGINLPQVICNYQIEEIRKKNPTWKDVDYFIEYLEKLKKNEDEKLLEIFEATWWGMPENMSVRSERGFFDLCDLCSESWVFYPEE